MLEWLWVPLTLGASASQTARTAMQRGLTSELGALGATNVRFLWGLPFALLAFGAITALYGPPPAPDLAVLAWTTLGGLSQVAATALLLLAMKTRAFMIAVAYTKAEPAILILMAWAALGEAPAPAQIGAILLATAGVMLMSWPSRERRGDDWLTPLGFGLASGALFALSAVGFRSAILALGEGDTLVRANLVLVISLIIQSAVLTGWLAWREPAALARLISMPRRCVPAGFCGALASQLWFLAFALQTAPLVRTLGLVEILYSQIVTRRVFAQTLTAREYVGAAALSLGLVGLFLG